MMEQLYSRDLIIFDKKGIASFTNEVLEGRKNLLPLIWWKRFFLFEIMKVVQLFFVNNFSPWGSSDQIGHRHGTACLKATGSCRASPQVRWANTTRPVSFLCRAGPHLRRHEPDRTRAGTAHWTDIVMTLIPLYVSNGIGETLVQKKMLSYKPWSNSS
jgi:hypothetical protein